ncbi:MAG: 2-hydroxyglutaryl-CoA dehydratase [Spirochaetales bacterium]|nr:2-hydroxyglutaryl-CoA dehydratase [Spirochaetales bacterium]
MKKDAEKMTFLIPNMAPIHFGLIRQVFVNFGYGAVLLENTSSKVLEAGLKYVHNDICYPAQLVIGQFIDALNSGKYDRKHTALFITQTGGGCRASNYYYLLKKALKRSGFEDVEVISLNLKGMNRSKTFHLNPIMMIQAFVALIYGDLIMMLANQTRPYEKHQGDADAMIQRCLAILGEKFSTNRGYLNQSMRANFRRITEDFAGIPICRIPKVKVGIVGEIYMKYSELGNNHLQSYLESQGCEVVLPGMSGFIFYGFDNVPTDRHYYGGKFWSSIGSGLMVRIMTRMERNMLSIVRKQGRFEVPSSYHQMKKNASGLLDYGVKMGEGWLLPAEMLDLAKSGTMNIVCTQPFGCLANHIVAKGMIRSVSAMTGANIVAIDYDASATEVNQENRIKLMLSIARERLGE